MPTSSVPEQGREASLDREELLNLLSASATLAGLCITVVTLMNTFDKRRAAVSIVDDIFAVCATAFLLCIYLIFWALRTRKSAWASRLSKVIDAAFLAALTTMTGATFIMIYTIW